MKKYSLSGVIALCLIGSTTSIIGFRPSAALFAKKAFQCSHREKLVPAVMRYMKAQEECQFKKKAVDDFLAHGTLSAYKEPDGKELESEQLFKGREELQEMLAVVQRLNKTRLGEIYDKSGDFTCYGGSCTQNKQGCDCQRAINLIKKKKKRVRRRRTEDSSESLVPALDADSF